MIAIGVIFLLLVVILFVFSAWNLDKVMLICLTIGLICIDINHYNNYGNYDVLGFVGELMLISFFFYFINVYKIMNRKIFNIVKAGEFKEYLDVNNIFFGYNKFVYYFPGFILFLSVIYCVIYYSLEA